jgi:sulfide:quinone oxidoreductase
MKQLVILGAGTAGTMMANRLVRRLDPGLWSIRLVDRDNDHLYQPGLLLVPFGSYDPRDLVRPRTQFVAPGVELCLAGFERVDPASRQVLLGDGQRISYDILVIATGAALQPDLTEGLTGPGWRRNSFDFYTLEGATALAAALERFEGGRIVLNVAENPIKCPVAPLEFLFLADAFFQERGRRSKVELIYATPLEGAFTKPKASALLGDMLSKRNIYVETDFLVSRVDGEAGKIHSWDGRSLPFDLLVEVPVHGGAEAIRASGLGDAQGWVPTDPHSLQSTDHPEIFVLGDATNLPVSKAGSVAHFQGEVLTENILRYIRDLPLLPDFDGHANCFIETGHGKAMLIDFNYKTEPLPGRFPLPGIGPFTLLEESAVNHWGKLGFRWIYWNMLLRGEDLPLDHRMLLAGKWS